ncbi:MAG: DUF4230 domain-containing protein [Treponema sp.]|jgi:hypothetical protein|nr:DUF4230 domain-containing protein [Treponema sp.]
MKFAQVLIILILGIVAGIAGGLFISNNLNFDFFNKETSMNITSTVKEILPNAEYASLVYHYSSVITHSDSNKFFDFNIPFTEKKAIYTIDGTVKLGLNCKDISIDNRYNNIILRMPAIKILSHEMFPETFSLYDEQTSIFNRYGLKDANDIQMAHKKEMEEKVSNNSGLFVQARQSAEQQFRLFIESIPGVKTQYGIVFEWQM